MVKRKKNYIDIILPPVEHKSSTISLIDCIELYTRDMCRTIGICFIFRLCPNQGYADPPPSVLVQFLWMMGSVLNRMRKIIK